MRIFTLTSFAALVLFAAVSSAQGPAEITRYPLPADVVYPEGIALDAARNAFYTGNAENGTLIRMQLNNGQSTVVAKAVLPAEPFPTVLGMTLDAANRLWISGGRTGRMAVIDANTGNVLKRFETTTPASSLINDVTIAGSNAYFTDTFTPTLWRVTTKGSEIGELEAWLSFEGTPVQFASGPNLNGITATPDGRHLIVVQMNKGLLFRIDVADKRITPIDVGGEALTGADGLVLDGTTLYVVRQTEEEIATVELAADFGSGRVTHRFKNPVLAWPATAAKWGDRLLLVNTQFNKRPEGKAPFEIVGVPLSLLK